MNFDYTKILAIYGAIISTIVLLLRFRDRSDKKRKLLIRIDKYVLMNRDQNNYYSGRKGDQYIRIRITNKSSNPNSIEKVELYSANSFLNFKTGFKKVDLNFDHNFKLPRDLKYSEMTQGVFFMNMDTLEFHKSWNSNYQILKKLKADYIFAFVHDTHGKKYKSNKIKIKDLLKDYLDEEKRIVSESYWNENYI